MKALGMIGGTSWHSTIEYYRMINSGVSKVIGSESNPPLILHSLNVQLMRRQQLDEINEKYLQVSRELERSGAQAILICANTPHQVYAFVQPQITIPILHIADAIGKEARKEQLKTLGLLGTMPTMLGNFIPERLKDLHLSLIHI